MTRPYAAVPDAVPAGVAEGGGDDVDDEPVECAGGRSCAYGLCGASGDSSVTVWSSPAW
ncbi:hypothetical protein AB0K67_37680 [Nonomuraea sp. NPDC052634]|uniref:hypothetical protein n=1 Tax=Nonomuraea sp. NPDC052634 TaxID=3155813 RepID=UPI0034477BA3